MTHDFRPSTQGLAAMAVALTRRACPGPTPARMVAALAGYTPDERARIAAGDAEAQADLRAALGLPAEGVEQ